MNRVGLKVCAGVLAVVASWLVGTRAQAQTPGVSTSAAATATAPRYFYGYGYNGLGYYYYPAVTTTTPAARGGFYSAPRQTVPDLINGPQYDWTSRKDRLSRPWLRSLR